MGYYASGYGKITFKNKLSDEQYLSLQQIEDINYAFDTVEFDKETNTLKVWQDEKYYETETLNVLYEILKVEEVESGVVEYCGEDDDHWRFIYRDGKWIEENAEIIYNFPAINKALKECISIILNNGEDPAILAELTGLDEYPELKKRYIGE